ncbi:hypothetical protein [Streptomyces sp. CB01635]|uniref:hypothetical protein n=1 Tax=unclassified Streptomyces TaxID=2593676 RepID=UPI001F3B9225|nr:hypothetical protein [Streptomyces sp. CB01635]
MFACTKLTVREALELYAAFYPRPTDWRTLAERLGLTAKLTTRFAKLSGGQKQRLFIALALIGSGCGGEGAGCRSSGAPPHIRAWWSSTS